jgi:CrcB protein
LSTKAADTRGAAGSDTLGSLDLLGKEHMRAGERVTNSEQMGQASTGQLRPIGLSIRVESPPFVPVPNRGIALLQILAIAGGGAIGALARFYVSTGVYRLLGRDFPWGTLSVNVLGSFAMGLLFVLLLERSLVSAEVRSALLVGFLGAFTTFSTFSLETLTLVEQGEMLRALLNVTASVLLCIAACWAGIIAARAL